MADDRSLLTEIPYGLPGKIFRSPMPFSPYDPLGRVWPAYKENQITAVVVLTEPHEYLSRAGRDLPEFYQSNGLEVIHLPIQDFQVPEDKSAVERALIDAVDHAQAGNNLAVHCMAGLGRTGIFTACLAKRHLGLDGHGAITWVRQFISGAMENPLQEQFVIGF